LVVVRYRYEDDPLSFTEAASMSQLKVYATWAALVLVAGAVLADEWSKPVRGLAGRLTAENHGGKVKLIVELKNDGVLPYWVTTHNPFAFDLVVKDATGKELKPASERVDILSSPQAAIVPRECRLAMPVTLTREERWNLDIVTKLWALKPGKYRLQGKYTIPGDDREPKLTGKAYSWQGELQLPEVTIEIRANTP
jgi:hypothetical protein